jgi:hypothetical protein
VEVPDIVPDNNYSDGPRLTRTLESKRINLHNYRTAQGGLDKARLLSVFRRHVLQALRHQRSASSLNQRNPHRMPLPTRESIVYHTVGASDAEATQLTRLFRSVASQQGVLGGFVRPSLTLFDADPNQFLDF